MYPNVSKCKQIQGGGECPASVAPSRMSPIPPNRKRQAPPQALFKLFVNTSCCISSNLWYYFRNLKAMIRKFGASSLLLAFCLGLLLPLQAEETVSKSTSPSTNAVATQV